MMWCAPKGPSGSSPNGGAPPARRAITSPSDDRAGHRFWVYREGAAGGLRWFLHGLFA